MADPHATEEHTDHQFWDLETSNSLRLEDSEAWRNVVGVLLLIVTVGIVLALMTVWLSS